MQEATVDEPEVNHEGFLEELDHALALSLQQEFDTQAAYSTATGKAWDFADRVTANHRRLLAYDQYAPNMNANNFSPVAPDDMVFLAERLFATQEAFRQQGKDARVDIGYHYTKLECMERIRTDGLLTKAERQAANISSISNGATFGDGIYTGMNAFSYHKFCGGDQGLLVARLQGLVVARPDGDNGVAVMGGADTVIGRGGSCDAVCVLQSSSQCLALVKFSADLIELENDASIGNEMVHAYHCSLQEIVDECFNGGVKTLVPKLLPSRVQQHRYDLHRIATSSQVIRYTAPGALSCADVSKALILIKAESATKGECSICLADLAEQGPVVSLADCSHRFHQACIEESAKITRKCPNCRAPIGAPQGTMPSGTMQIEFRSDLVCSGHNSGTIRIKYEIDAGLQMVYHDHPGEYHEGTVRVAYLPDIQEGRNLLKRLKFAFLRGLTFTVGTSHTSGRPNSVTWTSIHHKTSLCEGAHGYPDLGYFINANEELDALHVPSSDAL